MNAENINENSSGCTTKLFDPCLNLIPNISIRQTIYPLQPIAPDDSEFFEINSKLRNRIIHVKPDNKNYLHRNSAFDRRNPYRSSLSEEYWFTKCNKPLRQGSCNCSFRRSHRLSSNNFNDIPQKQTINSNNVRISVKIVNIETFVERLMQETLVQAFQEYFIINTKNSEPKKCFDNPSYSDDTKSVILRKKVKTKNIEPAILHVSDSETNHEKYTFTVNKSCSHSKGTQKKEKPLVILFHGIGSSADVWWKLINSLISKGYEVIAPDMLGHGYSSTPTKSKLYSFKSLLNHALAIFDHYVTKHTAQTSIIIGHSFGCSIATGLYRFRPQQILQLVLISGGGPTPLAASVRNNELSPFSCAEVFLKPLLVCGLKRRFFYSSRGKHFEPCLSENAIPKNVIESIAYGQNWPEGDAAYHRRILIPTLLVHGLQDTKVTLVQECEMERTIPRAFLELIPDAGHMVMLDTPEQLAHMILCFLDWWTK